MEENYRDKSRLSLFGAHSVTKTIVNHYKAINEDEDDTEKLFNSFKEISERENIQNKSQVIVLRKLFNLLLELKVNPNRIITKAEYESFSEDCKSYVNSIFENFECFVKGEDGRYYYYPK